MPYTAFAYAYLTTCYYLPTSVSLYRIPRYRRLPIFTPPICCAYCDAAAASITHCCLLQDACLHLLLRHHTTTLCGVCRVWLLPACCDSARAAVPRACRRAPHPTCSLTFPHLPRIAFCLPWLPVSVTWVLDLTVLLHHAISLPSS